MRISRKPTGAKFFELFTEIGANIGSSVELLREFVRAPAGQRAELAARMHALENAGDDATHAIIEHLDRSFVTPFDREDIYRLASRLDDVVDHMDAAVDLASSTAWASFRTVSRCRSTCCAGRRSSPPRRCPGWPDRRS